MSLSKKLREDKDTAMHLMIQLGIIDNHRKSCRKIAATFLRKYNSLISNKKIRNKIRGNHFSDLVDSRVIETLNDVYDKI
jgi:hypothetical protein